MVAHNIDHVEFWQYTQTLKHVDRRNRSTKQLAKRYKRNLLAAQHGECVLCEGPIAEGSNLFLVLGTDKVVCQRCHLGLALLRSWAGCGVTAERIAPLIPEFFTVPGQQPRVQPQRLAQPQTQAPTSDPLLDLIDNP
jgi:hypothetical protein